jgi:hypothetical protein
LKCSQPSAAATSLDHVINHSNYHFLSRNKFAGKNEMQDTVRECRNRHHVNFSLPILVTSTCGKPTVQPTQRKYQEKEQKPIMIREKF